MTKEEAIQDYIRELKEHDYSVVESQLGSSREKNNPLYIKNKYGRDILAIAINDHLFDPIFLELKCSADADDLIEYSWLLMRTAIFLQDLERIGAI